MIDQMSSTDLGVTGAAIAALASAVYALWDKYRTRQDITNANAVKLQAEKATNEAAEAKTAVDQWERYVKARERQHNLDVDRLKAQIDDNQRKIDVLLETKVVIARLEEQLKHLKEENERMREENDQMKTAFRRMGAWPDDEAPPWLHGMPDRRVAEKSASGKWYVGPERRVAEEKTDDTPTDK